MLTKIVSSLRRVEEEVPLAVVGLDAAEAPGAVLADHEDHVVMLAEAAPVTHTDQGHPPPPGLTVHLSLQILAHATRGLVKDGQPRASEQHPRPGQSLLLPGTEFTVPEIGGHQKIYLFRAPSVR